MRFVKRGVLELLTTGGPIKHQLRVDQGVVVLCGYVRVGGSRRGKAQQRARFKTISSTEEIKVSVCR